MKCCNTQEYNMESLFAQIWMFFAKIILLSVTFHGFCVWEKIIIINIIMIRVVVRAALDIFEGRLYTVFHLLRNHRTLTLTWVFEVIITFKLQF